MTEANSFILFDTRLHLRGACIFILFTKLFLLCSHSSIKSNHHKPKYRKYLEAFRWYCGDLKNGKWLAAAFVLRDLFLPVSTCYRQTNKTDALGMGSLWVHHGIRLPVLRNSDKLVCLAASASVSHPKGNRQTKHSLFLPITNPRALFKSQFNPAQTWKWWRDVGGFLSVEPIVFISVFSVCYIITHSK